MTTVSYTQKVAKSVILITVISFFTAIVAYFFRLFMARNLSVEEYGLFFSVFSLIAFFSIFRDLGFFEGLTKFIPEFLVNKDEKSIKASFVYTAVIGLSVSLITFLLLVALSDFISKKYVHSTTAGPIIILISLSFFFYGGELLLRQTFLGFQKMILFSSINLTRSVLLFVLTYTFIKLGFGLVGVAYSYIITPLIIFLLYGYLFLTRVFPNFWNIQLVYDSYLYKRIVHFAVPTFLGMGFGVIISYTDTIMLTLFSGVASVGLYNSALPTASFLNYILTPFRNVLYPLSSELWTKKYYNHLRQGIAVIYKYSFMIMLPLVLIFVSFSDMIINILFGYRYIEAHITLKILSIGFFILSISQINYVILAGIGKPKLNTQTSLIAAIMNIILNAALIPLFNINGAAIATTLSFLFMFCFSLYYIKSNIQLEIPLLPWLKNIIVGLIFLVIIIILKSLINLNIWLELIIILTISGLIYISLLFILKLISINEIKDIYKRITRLENESSNKMG